MQYFKINHKVLVKLLIKRRLQKPKRLASAYGYIAPVIRLYNRFVTYYNATLYRLAHTSQVCYIRGLLNDRWDEGLRRIEVVDGKNLDPLYIFKTVENKPKYIRKTSENMPVWLYQFSETYPNGIDFIILVPSIIAYDQAEMIAMVSEYRLPGRDFIIQQI